MVPVTKLLTVRTQTGIESVTCWKESRGLAITRALGSAEDSRWVITHVASGMQVGPWPMPLKVARRALELLLPLADWDRGKPVFVNPTETQKQAYYAILTAYMEIIIQPQQKRRRSPVRYGEDWKTNR